MFYFGYLPSFHVISLIAGVLGLVAVLFWPRSKSKYLMFGFLMATMIVLPVFDMAVNYWVSSGGYRSWNRQQAELIRMGYLGLFTSGLLLLFAYLIVRNFEKPGNRRPVSGKPGDEVGPRWSTEVDRHKKLETMRRREWAFLIDVVPLFALILLLVFGAAYGTSRWLGPVFLLGFPLLFLASLVYLLVKDAHAGVSWGKKLTGTTVIDAEHGTPIGVRET